MRQVTARAEGSRPGAPMFRRLVRLYRNWRSQSGQGLVEYGLILVVVSIVAIFLMVALGGQLNNMFSDVVYGGLGA
jgi:pilus assembly protein Flp/PilA